MVKFRQSEVLTESILQIQIDELTKHYGMKPDDYEAVRCGMDVALASVSRMFRWLSWRSGSLSRVVLALMFRCSVSTSWLN